MSRAQYCAAPFGAACSSGQRTARQAPHGSAHPASASASTRLLGSAGLRILRAAPVASALGAPTATRAGRTNCAMRPVTPAAASGPCPGRSAPRRLSDGSGRDVAARAAASSTPAGTDSEGAAASAPQEPGAGATQPSANPPQLPTYHHLIVPPVPGGGDECLLAIVPGALLPPAAFEALAKAVQKAAAPQLRLWVGVMNIDFLDIKQNLCSPEATIPEVLAAMDQYGSYGKLLGQVVDQATAQGFVARREGPARLSNLVVVCQSAGCLGFAPAAAKSAAATVLLGGVHNVPDYTQMGVFSLEAWSRPLMLLVGELDGQMRWPRLSSYVAENAAMAAKFGPSFACTHKPVVVVPGLNHGNTSNGEARVARGDITAGVAEHAECMETLGGLIASFLTAHLTTSEAARSQARRALLDAVRQSAQLTAPYCIARGLGDVTAPFVSGSQRPPFPSASSVGPCLAGGLVAGSQRVAGRTASTALPPSEVVAAESHAVSLQWRVLSGLPPSHTQRLQVVATAHTDVETFLYSQPLMVPLEVEEEVEAGGAQQPGRDTQGGGPRWLLHVHVLLHYKCLDAPGQFLAPQAPDYWLKLKSTQLVAALLGLPEPSQYDSPVPSELNRMSLEAALGAVPAGVAERYRTLGRQLEFGPDVDVLAPGLDGAPPAAATPEAFVRHSRLSFHYPPPAPASDAPTPVPSGPDSAAPAASTPPAGRPAGPVRVVSPYLLVAPPGDVASRSPGEVRFLGPYYVKLLSPAQAMEWVALDCLRQGIDTPW